MHRRRVRGGRRAGRGRLPAISIGTGSLSAGGSGAGSASRSASGSGTDDDNMPEAPVSVIAAAASAAATRAAKRIRPTSVAASVAAADVYEAEDGAQLPDPAVSSPALPEARTSRYIEKLVAQASKRKDAADAALERRLARERELEGDLYAGKEKFVTAAYKEKLAQNEGTERENDGDGARRLEQANAMRNAELGVDLLHAQASLQPALERQKPRTPPHRTGSGAASIDGYRVDGRGAADKPTRETKPLRGLRRNDTVAVEAYRQRYFARRDARAKAVAEGRMRNSLVPW
jgi:Coiled-coil domain-containing protein 55 (DUF2040)